MAFSRPDGDGAGSGLPPALDLDHLSRQTMGDRALEREVLALFLNQLGAIGGRIGDADADERRRLAHRLKGSACGVGAFALADCAAAIESDPRNGAHLARLGRLIGEARDFVAAVGG